MADDQNGDGKGVPEFRGRPRPPQTIDLQAEDVTAPEPGDPRREAEDSAAHHTVVDSVRTEKPAEEPEAAGSDPQLDDPGRDDQSEMTPPTSSWGAIGAASGLMALLLVLALGTGLWAAGMFGANTGAALRKRVDALESAQKTLAARPQATASDAQQLQALAQRLTALEDKAKQPANAASAAPLGAITAKVKALEETMATLGRRVDADTAATREARGRAEAALIAATTAQDKARDTASTQKDSRQDIAQDIAPLQGRLTALESATKQMSDNAVQKSTVAALSDRIAAIETGLKTARDHFERQDTAAARTLRALVTLQALRTTVDRGAPYSAELDAMKPFAPNAEATAPLATFAAKGMPTEDALTRDFKTLMPALSHATAPKAEGDGIFDRLQASAERLVRVRRVGDVQGDTPDALLARAQARVAAHDLAGAAAALDKLPAAARAPAQNWIDTVKARNAALAALQHLAVTLPATSTEKPAANPPASND
ncbi:MAG TPA: mitofilin family membrane protein [Xanthobacteraceae bacterium]|jgi:hypothetical protein|nr:mitofilin family membrane protein [Xanthobacteraceae bacterium]